MIDIDLLERAVKKVWYTRSSEEDAVHSHVISGLGILDIIIRLRQAEKDAARYRWLRDESAFTHENAPLTFFTDTNGDQIAFDFNGSSYSVLHDEMLDAAIDEAMQCK